MPDPTTELLLSTSAGLRAQNAGLFVSRGEGGHPRRVIGSHELIFVVGGTLHMREEETRFDLCAGQALLLWPGREHAGVVPYGPDTSFYWIHFELEALGAVAAAATVVPQVATVARPEVLTGLFRRFLDDQESGLLMPAAAAHWIALMLHEIALHPRESAVTGQAAALAARAQQYIIQHYGEPRLSASRIGRALDCHPDHLGRCFRAAYGHTLTDAIHRQRLKRARALLMDTNAGIDEIARCCGFPGTAFFRRVFRRQEGMSPSAYRIQYARVHINTI